MAVLTIGGVAMPSPTSLQIGVEDISNAERNAKGKILIERIATKQKLELEWTYLTAANLKTILAAVAATTFNVTYRDPVTDTDRTATFYAGGRSVGVMDYIGGAVRYKDVKFNLIET